MHRIVNNSGWLVFDRIIRLLLGLLIGAWVIRYLGPEQYGALAYVLSIMAFFQSIVSFGLDGIVVRDIANNRAFAGNIIGTVFVLRVFIGFLCWISAIVFMVLFEGSKSSLVIITAVVGGVLVFQSADTIDLWFQSQTQSKRTVIAKMVAYLLSNGAKIVLIIAKAPLIAFAGVMVFDALAVAIGLLIAYRFFPVDGHLHVVRSSINKILHESWPYMISGISVMIYMRIDQIMIKNMLDEKSLGIYAAALPLSQLWNIIPTTLVVSLAPFVAKKKIESNEAYEKALLQIFRLFGIFGILVSITTALFAPIITGLLFGKSYSGTSTVLSIHVFTNVFIAQGVAQSIWLLNERMGHISLYKTLAGVAAAVAGNLYFIPKYGINGAAISAVCSYGVSAFLSNAIFAPRIFLMQMGFFLKEKNTNDREN